MAKSQTISVRIFHAGPKGIAVLKIPKNKAVIVGQDIQLTFDADSVRQLYYRVLGIKDMDERSLQEIVDSAKGLISVDVPEDVLRVQKVIQDEQIKKMKKIMKEHKIGGQN